MQHPSILCLCQNQCCLFSVVAECIIQNETKDDICEALSVLKLWNPDWEPKLFLTDYSDAEIGAINKLFSRTQVYLRKFYREQGWEHWVKDKKHGLTSDQALVVPDKLWDCANIPPNCSDRDKPVDYYYLNAVEKLKEIEVWKSSHDVQQWLYSNLLSYPKITSNMFICVLQRICFAICKVNHIILSMLLCSILYILFSFGPVLTEIKQIMHHLTLQMGWNPRTNY